MNRWVIALVVCVGVVAWQPWAARGALFQTDSARITSLETLVTNINTELNAFKTESKKKFELNNLTNPPVGSIVAFGGAVAQVPENWRVCDGSTVSETMYPDLWRAIGTSWGGINGSSFNLPNLRGRFLRGVDLDAKVDPDAKSRKSSTGAVIGARVGSFQEDRYERHDHKISDPRHSHSATNGQSFVQWNGNGRDGVLAAFQFQGIPVPLSKITDTEATGITVQKNGDSEETRPKNASVYWIIKVK